ncbi:asmA family domain protein [Burkholderia mallei]|nr:asmA family domain protein [Burkholderia mallei]
MAADAAAFTPDAPLAAAAPLAFGAPAADAADASDAIWACALAANCAAPRLPTRCADAARDVSSCCRSTSPSGIGWPSVSTATLRSAFVIASR